MMSIACLLVPSFALACELAERPAFAGDPVALADVAGRRVEDATPEAQQRGVRPGMTLREAVAYCPTLGVLDPHPARTARMADALVGAMAAVSPRVAQVEPGTVLADLVGLEGLYPDPELIERAILRAAPVALSPRLGVAERRFTAYAAARSVPAGVALRIEPDQAGEFLADKPAQWLPLDAERHERLRLLGITSLGEFATLPRHAVQAQFGVAGGRAWLAARGEDPTPLRPQPFARERVVEHAEAQPPLVSRETVQVTMQQLLGRALRQPRASRRFVRVVRLRAVTEDGHLWERTQTMKEPTGDRERLWTSIRPHLEYAGYPGPIAELELELGGLTAESGRQQGFFTDRARCREQLDAMVRHMKVRYGQSPVARVVEVEPWSRIPERRHALLDYDP
ncbi:MAG TPA: DNA polymerase Y family protein [Dehalococcoidia bacterium]|nr:DNA polymerase Y family protein [Dehalococcoidia bacterium]